MSSGLTANHHMPYNDSLLLYYCFVFKRKNNNLTKEIVFILVICFYKFLVVEFSLFRVVRKTRNARSFGKSRFFSICFWKYFMSNILLLLFFIANKTGTEFWFWTPRHNDDMFLLRISTVFTFVFNIIRCRDISGCSNRFYDTTLSIKILLFAVIKRTGTDVPHYIIDIVVATQ